MKLLEQIKNKLVALVLALWAWTQRKAIEWKLRERAIALWEKTRAFWASMGQKWRGTKAHEKLMAMEPLQRRMTIMLCGVFLLLGLIFAFNQLKTFMIKHFIAGMGLPPATVSTLVITNAEWQPKLTSVGNVRAFRGVELSTEIGGLVQTVPIKSGQDVKEGELLIKLNDASDVAQLNSLKAMADLAKVINERDRQQLAIQAISKNVFDTSAADSKSKQAQVEQQTALVAKKNLKAPFSGRVGIVSINPGQYVNPGDKLLTLQTLDPIFVDFNLPQNNAELIQVGQEVEVTTDAFKDEAQQVFVTTGLTRGDQVAILKGVDEGATVVTSGQLKLKNGTPLIINNKVQPANSPDPKPQE